MVPNGIPVPLPCSELASRKPSRPAVKGDRTNRPDIWLQAIRSKLCAGSCKQGAVHIWLAELLKRKPPKLAAVALANKMARIAWKLMVSGQHYNPAHAVAAATDKAAA